MRPQKRKHKKVLGDHDDDEAESSSSPRAAKRSRGSMFTNSHETFIAERLADREFCLLWSRPSCKSRFEAQSSFCDKFTLDFNHKFDTDIGSTQMRNKINYMIRQWKEAYILKCSPVNSDHQSRSKLDSRIKSFCHYFDLMEPTWATCSAIAETEKCPEVQETDNDDDDDKSDVDNDDNDGDGEDDGDGDDDDDDDTDTDGDQSRNEHERETESTGDNEEDRDKAIVAPSKVLDMLKATDDTDSISRMIMEMGHSWHSWLAEIQTREETKRVQVREEEETKRKAIRAEVDKMKYVVKIKKLEVEHTKKMLLLEGARMRRIMMENKRGQVEHVDETAGKIAGTGDQFNATEILESAIPFS